MAGPTQEKLPPSGATLPALAAAGVVLLAGVLLGQFGPQEWRRPFAIVACLGHAVTAAVLVALLGELLRLGRCRRDLRQFPSIAGGTWVESAWQFCRQQLPIPANATPDDYQRWTAACIGDWKNSLVLRFYGYFGLVLLPCVLGLLLGLQTLPARVGTSASLFGELMVPLTIGTVESLLLGAWAYFLWLGWDRLFLELREVLWRELARHVETLARREAALNEREALLVVREKELQEREAVLKALEARPAPAMSGGGWEAHSETNAVPAPEPTETTRMSSPTVIEKVEEPEW